MIKLRPLLIVASLLVAATATAGTKPNIIFMFSDDHALQAISAYSGGTLNQTPNIDRLASEGALFLRSSVVNSICAPSRAAILTGTHSHINGQRQNGDVFNGDQMTFPKILQTAGYKTALIGKWHLRSDPQGFDYSDVMTGQGEYYNPNFRRNSGEPRIVEGYNTVVVADLGLQWLEAQLDSGKDEPFFLALQFKAPHRNWMPNIDKLYAYDDVVFPEPDTLLKRDADRTEAAQQQEMEIGQDMRLGGDLKTHLAGHTESEYARMDAADQAAWDRFIEKRQQSYQDAGGEEMSREALARWKYQAYLRDYMACVDSVDDQIGRVLDFLEAKGLAENTLVVYSSDQGFYLGERGWFDKRWMYGESFAMPLMARMPGLIKPGTRISKLTQNIDYGPTFLELAGCEVPERMQGRSLLPLMQGEVPEDWREAAYYHFYAENESHNVPVHEGVTTERYKLIHFYGLGLWELYDLESDPKEQNNVYENPAYAEVREKMHAQLQALRKQYQVGETNRSKKKPKANKAG